MWLSVDKKTVALQVLSFWGEGNTAGARGRPLLGLMPDVGDMGQVWDGAWGKQRLLQADLEWRLLLTLQGSSFFFLWTPIMEGATSLFEPQYQRSMTWIQPYGTVQKEIMTGPLSPRVTVFPPWGCEEAGLDADAWMWLKLRTPFHLASCSVGVLQGKRLPVALSWELCVTTHLSYWQAPRGSLTARGAVVAWRRKLPALAFMAHDGAKPIPAVGLSSMVTSWRQCLWGEASSCCSLSKHYHAWESSVCLSPSNRFLDPPVLHCDIKGQGKQQQWWNREQTFHFLSGDHALWKGKSIGFWTYHRKTFSQ